MSLEPLVVDSIKDRIVRSVWALGTSATRAGLRKAVDCMSSVLELAIDALHRDGYIYISEAGHYALADELVAAMPKPRADIDDVLTVATVARTEINQLEGEAMATTDTQQCRVSGGWGCGKTKPISQFYEKAAKCKHCTLDRQRKLKEARSKPATPVTRARKKNGASPEPPIADELVIQAAGDIRCQALDLGVGPTFHLLQGEDEIVASYEQMQALRDWADAQLKKAAAR